MSLPSTRNTSYNPDDPVLSNDINAIQDCLIAAKHGEIPMTVLGADGVDVAGVWAKELLAGVPIARANGGGSNEMMIPLRIPVGCRLKSASIWADRNGQTGTFRFKDVNILAGTQVDISNLLTINAGAGIAANAFAGIANPSVAAGHAFWLYCVSVGVGFKIHGINLVIDKLS